MNENSEKYKTPQEKLGTLLEKVENDLRKSNSDTTWQQLTEIWRNRNSSQEKIGVVEK
ncbi:MAG: hypothetical protein F6K36_29180 [Symploca sp. SIO3C6]|uniref:Uncharacterized protein n=1 Tax=Symploca sp. SIO1C4 TaxID=2607765 RepID=A0A6B3N8N8_9CYAN|nr:hypothetical protein [Symploca sp. SIO3C6]NER27833.1 hypothetical protein [Symploca sp. SIO1C4]